MYNIHAIHFYITGREGTLNSKLYLYPQVHSYLIAQKLWLLLLYFDWLVETVRPVACLAILFINILGMSFNERSHL